MIRSTVFDRKLRFERGQSLFKSLMPSDGFLEDWMHDGPFLVDWKCTLVEQRIVQIGDD